MDELAKPSGTGWRPSRRQPLDRDEHRRSAIVAEPGWWRIGGDGGVLTKMWQKRDFRPLRGETEIGTRNMKMALRRRAASSAKGGGRIRSRRNHQVHCRPGRHAGH